MQMWQERVCSGILMYSRSARFLSSDATLGVSNQCPLSSSRSLVQLSFATGIPVILSGDTRDSNLVDSASSIRLSQRLSHACLSTSLTKVKPRGWLIKSHLIYWIVNSYLDNCGNSGANTCTKPRTYVRGAFIRSKPNGFGCTLGDSE